MGCRLVLVAGIAVAGLFALVIFAVGVWIANAIEQRNHHGD